MAAELWGEVIVFAYAFHRVVRTNRIALGTAYAMHVIVRGRGRSCIREVKVCEVHVVGVVALPARDH